MMGGAWPVFRHPGSLSATDLFYWDVFCWPLPNFEFLGFCNISANCKCSDFEVSYFDAADHPASR